MKEKLEIRADGQIFTVSNGKEEKSVEIINTGLLRVYQKKNSEQLVKLHYDRENINIITEETSGGIYILFSNYRLHFSDNLTLSIERDGKEYFKEYGGDTTIYVTEKDFSLAELEGHKRLKKQKQILKPKSTLPFLTVTIRFMVLAIRQHN